MRETRPAGPASQAAGNRGSRRRVAAVATLAGALAGGLAAISAPAGAAAGTGRPAAPASAAAAASWRIVKTTHGRSLPGVTAVTATGTRDAWAFASTLARPVAWRLTGRTWATVPFPGQTGDLVTAAASSAPGNVWAFTAQTSGAGRALRWNGRRWAAAGRFGQAVGDAVALSPADVWVFGQPGAPGGGLGTWHYNGTTWRRAPAGGGLTGGSALSPSSVWAVGGKTAAHWNGRTWSRTSLARVLPGNTQFCRPTADRVLARSATDVWAVGAGHCEDERGPFYLLHFNGSRWRLVWRSARYGEPLQVVADGSGGLWIPAVAGFPGSYAMLHYTGGRLHQAALPLPASKLSVDAVAHVARSLVTFGGGESHPAGQGGTKQSGVILRYGG